MISGGNRYAVTDFLHPVGYRAGRGTATSRERDNALTSGQPHQLLGRLFRCLLQEYGEGLDPVRWLSGYAVAGINCLHQVLRRIVTQPDLALIVLPHQSFWR